MHDHESEMIPSSKKTSNATKMLRIYVFSILAAGAFFFAAWRFFGFLDTLAYRPVGTASEDLAWFAKWTTIIILPLFFPYLLRYILIPVLLGFALFKPKYRPFLLLVSLLLIENSVIADYEFERSHKIFEESLLAVANGAEPLINAIEQYNLEKGRYPDALSELSPEYIDAIPNTGMCGYPEFVYEKAQPGAGFSKYMLYIHTPGGGINFDRFLYWPEGGYPDYFYGGYSELIGKWAYIHE